MTTSDKLLAREAQREQLRQKAARHLRAWMAQYDFAEAKGLIEILIDEGFMSPHTILDKTEGIVEVSEEDEEY